MQQTSVPLSALDVVLSFYRLALLEKQPTLAFRRFMSTEFVEHKPDVESGTRESAASYLEELMSSLPGAAWEIVRAVADAELVAIHAKFTPEPGAQPYAIADSFKVRAGVIVERWDVVAGPSSEAQNPHPRF